MRYVSAVLVGVLLATPVLAQDAPKNPSRPQPAPRTPSTSTTPRLPARIQGQVYVGDRAPDFVLDGSRGAPVRLSSRRGSWVVLVFAEDRGPLGRLDALDGALAKLPVTTLGVCAEKARTLEGLAQRDSIATTWLADVTGEISALYGLYDFERSRIRPGFVLLDSGGIVRLALLGQELPVEDLARLVRFGITGTY